MLLRTSFLNFRKRQLVGNQQTQVPEGSILRQLCFWYINCLSDPLIKGKPLQDDASLSPIDHTINMPETNLIDNL